MKGRSHLLTKQARAALISSFSPASALHPKVISAPRCRKISAPPPPTASHTCALPIPSLSAHFVRSRPLFAGVKRHLRCRFWRARHSVVNSSSGRDGRSACRSQPPDGAAAWPFSCDRVAARLACRRWFPARTPSPQGRFWVCGAACAGPNQASWPRDVTVVLNLVFYQSCNGMDRCILPVSLVITHTQGR